MLRQILLSLIYISITATAAVAESNTIVDLGSLDGGTSSAVAINNLGQIVGQSTRLDSIVGTVDAPFVWDETNGMQWIVNGGVPFDINDSGRVVFGTNTWQAGQFFNVQNSCITGFSLTGKCLLGINNAGTLFALMTVPSTLVQFAFIENQAGTAVFGDQNSLIYDLNDNSQVVGENLGTNFAWIQTSEGKAKALNNQAHVAGESTGPSGTRGFIDRGGIITDLGLIAPPGVAGANVADINESGQVVGTLVLEDGTKHAFIYDSRIGLRNINTLLIPNTGWILQSAIGVNDSGQVAGTGELNGVKRAFRFELKDFGVTAPPTPPQPPPPPPIATAVGLAALDVCLKGKSRRPGTCPLIVYIADQNAQLLAQFPFRFQGADSNKKKTKWKDISGYVFGVPRSGGQLLLLPAKTKYIRAIVPTNFDGSGPVFISNVIKVKYSKKAKLPTF